MIGAPDHYCYPGTRVLKNKANIQSESELDEAMNDYASIAWAILRASPPTRDLDFEYLADAHHYMFGRLFTWAGHLRNVNLSPAGIDGDYCPHGEVEERLEVLFGRLAEEDYLQGADDWDFCQRVAHYWGRLTDIHPFRDGNTRSQGLWVSALATQAGHELNWALIDPVVLRTARMSARQGYEAGLSDYLRERLLPPGANMAAPDFKGPASLSADKPGDV
ncbi:Fic/DOC family protein [Aeromicrobium sp. JJY06]|uniref:Fic/DOC family protein n=1 Tax=Aeromicrobium sp. JJY06 TaxID=3373478 RepID=UPI00376F2825